MSRLSLPEPEWDLFTAEADKQPEAFHAELTALQREIMTEQAGGAWDKPLEGETQADFDLRVPSRLRRGITIIALLRRTHTGPAKVKNLTDHQKPKKRGRKTADLEAINASLLE